MDASCPSMTGVALNTASARSKNTVKESGPSFGGIFTILGPGGALLALPPLLSEAAGFDAELAGAAAAAGAACAPSALSFSVTELLIASTRASNCRWVMPAGGAVGVWAWTVAEVATRRT